MHKEEENILEEAKKIRILEIEKLWKEYKKVPYDYGINIHEDKDWLAKGFGIFVLKKLNKRAGR